MTACRPLHKLLELTASEASGEFVCASPKGEIHVFLHQGRIAWATDSKHPFAFATHVRTEAQIDAETFRHVVNECRRDKLPLGETLVALGLTTWDGVKGALAHQIGLAMSVLATVETAETLFLRRSYSNYDARLTFSARELMGDVVCDNSPTSGSLAAGKQGVPHAELAQTLRSSVDGLSWAEVLEEERVLATDPEVRGRRTPAEFVRTTVLDGADFAAIRSAGSTVVGLRLTDLRSVWCRVSADATFGSVVSAIWAVAGAPEVPPGGPPPEPAVPAWTLGLGQSRTSELLCSFMRRAGDVMATVLLARRPALEPVAGCGCAALTADACVDIARRRRGSFVPGPLPGADARERDLDSLGFYLKTMVSGEQRLWCFGAELELPHAETAWLFLDRRYSQGLGWAYLASLKRGLARAEGEP